MRNINKMPPGVYLFLTVVASLVSMIVYRATLFQCLRFFTYGESKTILWLMWGVSLVVTYLLTYKRRRNYLSLFTNTILPFAFYSLMIYENSHMIICLVLEMITVIFSGIYCFAVLARKIKTDDLYKAAVILKNRLKSCVNGTKTISALCFSVLLIYVSALYAFDSPSLIPAVKPAVTVSENRSEELNENMPVISKIDESIWKNISLEEKVDVMQTLANVEKTQLGISHEVNVCAEFLGFSTYGSYDYSTHTVTLNTQILQEDDSTEAVTTLCHELRHAFQHDVTDAYLSLDKEYQQLRIFDEVRKYYENLDDYQSASRDGFDEYESQTVEADSREYSKEQAAFYFWAVDKYFADAA